MGMEEALKKRFSLVAGFALLLAGCFFPFAVLAGPYLDSAHGNATDGVSRSAIDGQYSAIAVGNCAHCHEAHASKQGSEPLPVGGAPSAHTLFADNFNSDRTQSPYLESDNFCFACHSETTGQQVVNLDYSATFGGGVGADGPQSIFSAFNLTSYHNLNDISVFLQNNPTLFPSFNANSNPCSACHNSHLAKRNWDSGMSGFPLLSAISRPDAPRALWGESELMSAYLGYEAPYSGTDVREPAGIGIEDGSNTPDYVAFCTSCHNQNNTIFSTVLNRDLKKINWSTTGLGQDKHGELTRDGASSFRDPYQGAQALKNNFVLSCLDCHEPHGSDNVMMLRRQANGETLEGVIAGTDDLGFICKRCHSDDLTAAAGTGEANRWEYVHHLATDAPYPQAQCGNCHGMGGGGMGGEHIGCDSCHGHGMDDSALGTSQSGRITF